MKNEIEQKTSQKNLRDWLLNNPQAQKDLASLTKGLMSGERLVNVLYQCVAKNPALANCTPLQLMTATKTLLLMGCEPDGVNGYLVPVRNCIKDASGKKTWVQGVMPVPSARGLMRMAKQNGITNIQTGAVRENEYFRWGVKDGKFSCSHLPNLEAKDTAKVLYYYVLWNEKDGQALHGELMTAAEVESIRSRSKAANDGPWMTDYEQMALKTVIKRAAKMWPLPYETTSAMQDADTAEFAEEKAMRNVTTIQPAPESLPIPEQQEQKEEQPWDQQEKQPELLEVPADEIYNHD